VRQILEEGHLVVIDFVKPAGLRVVLGGPRPALEADSGPVSWPTVPATLLRWEEGCWQTASSGGIVAAAATVLEVGIPIRLLSNRAATDGPIRFSVSIQTDGGVSREQYPRDGAISVDIPDARLAAQHWTA
jgi:hypothetical protein